MRWRNTVELIRSGSVFSSGTKTVCQYFMNSLTWPRGILSPVTMKKWPWAASGDCPWENEIEGDISSNTKHTPANRASFLTITLLIKMLLGVDKSVSVARRKSNGARLFPAHHYFCTKIFLGSSA